MEVFGRRQRPRLLVLGVDEGSEFGRHLTELVPTIRFLQGPNELETGVRQLDWDALVIWDYSKVPGVAPHLFVLQFGGDDADGLEIPDIGYGEVSWGPYTVATEYLIPDAVPVDVARLVRSDLVPLALEVLHLPTIEFRIRSYRSAVDLSSATTAAIVGGFLSDPDGLSVAGRFVRSGGVSEWWMLPADGIAHPERWAALALETWRGRNEERFPGEASWRTRAEWQTPDEIAVHEERRRLEQDWADAARAYEQEQAALDLRLSEATQAADEGERRLLTAQGEELVAEVVATLREVGFTVVDVDAELSVEGDRREDIRVSHPSAPGWLALGEVRGYSKGAQLNDLLRLSRFVSRFAREEGREPDSVWYVVNHSLNTDPTVRSQPLAGNAEEVATFAEGGGLVIDTSQLFQLRSSVRRGLVGPADAAQALRETRGQFTWK